MLDFAFQKDGVYRMNTGCLAENRGSERIMQKCGMIQEACRPDWEWHDGKMKSRVEYRLLREEYEAGRDKQASRKKEGFSLCLQLR